MIASNLELHRMATKRQSRVVTSLTMLKSHLFKYQGHIGAALVLGGFDLNGGGVSLGRVSAFTPRVPFAHRVGSRMLAAPASGSTLEPRLVLARSRRQVEVVSWVED